MVGPAGVGVRRAAGGRTGAGPVIILGAWAVAAREKARAATVSKEIQKKVWRQQCKTWKDGKSRKVGKKKNKRKSLVHALITSAKEHHSKANSFPFPSVIKYEHAK